MKKLIILTIIAFVTVGCSNLTSQGTAPKVVTPIEGEVAYDDGEITFNHLKDWEVSTDNGITMVATPSESEEDFMENINFIKQEYASSDLTFDEFVKLNVENIEKMLEKTKGELLVKGEDATINDQKAKKYVYTYDMYDVSAITTQYYLDKNGVGYLVTITTSVDEKDKFAQEFENILKTYVIKEVKSDSDKKKKETSQTEKK